MLRLELCQHKKTTATGKKIAIQKLWCQSTDWLSANTAKKNGHIG